MITTMQMTPHHEALGWASVFDRHDFREYADIVIRKLVAYLGDGSVRGLKIEDPYELTAEARRLMTERHDRVVAPDPATFEALVDLYIRTGIQVHSPGFMGRQFSGIMPLAGAIDMIGTIVNQPASFYEAGQLPNVAERIMAAEFNRFIGWPEGRYDMVSTSGGALGNLTAILAARNERYPNLWERGYHNLGTVPAIAVSAECHYSLTRAAGILGIGEQQIIKLPLDEQRRIRVEAIDPMLDDAQARGLDVFCLVAAAGTTSIGAIDPLDRIADITQQRHIWLHVDGAHGGAMLVSDRFRSKLHGIHRADSFILDAHKTLFLPTACSLLFYQDKARAYKAFQQEASYVFDKDAGVEALFDSAGKNFECTKRPAIMNLWAMWALYGQAAFAGKLDHLMEQTQAFHAFLQTQDDFEAVHQPELNIICFRYAPPGVPDDVRSKLQENIKKRINQDAKFMISKVDLDNVTALRVVFMNHLIGAEHYQALIADIRTTGQAVLEELIRGRTQR